MQDNRYHFVYEQDGVDQQLWIHADGFARAYDKFWSQLDGEDIDKIEVEEHKLVSVDGTEVFEYIPSGVI
jgi:hypothetical protein